MNDLERALLRYVCEGDIRKAQAQAQIVLSKLSAKKDQQFQQNMLKMLEEKKQKMLELPYDVRSLLYAEDVSGFKEDRFLLRDNEAAAASEILRLYAVADKLTELDVSHPCALMLYGESGCGKTMLARYIAYKAELPFVYVRFSRLVVSTLGSTQSNVAKVFDYARSSPCVLCFDEIDAVGVRRGEEHDVSEMGRVVIALMQEMDRLPNNVIIVGTTNRFDRLDPALARRFPYQHEIMPLSCAEARMVAQMFFDDTGVDASDWVDAKWAEAVESEGIRTGNGDVSAAHVVKECTEKLIEILLEQKEHGEER